jgi:hypothetical protein
MKKDAPAGLFAIHRSMAATLSEPLPALSKTLTPAELAELGRRWTAAMLDGDFERAWCETDRLEIPRRAQPGLHRTAHHLVWDGTPFENRHVLVRCEHGLGDTLQFARYCAVLRRAARSVTLEAQPALLPVLHGLPGIDCLLDAWTADPDPPHDVAIECMELPYSFRHTAATLPGDTPYLSLPHILSRAHFRLPPRKAGLAIGLIWAASDWNPRRSIPLEALAPLLAVPDVECFSLQQGTAQADLASCGWPIVPLSQHTAEIREAAAAMLALDLIITVDSMTAHLAGALGRPTWLLLTHEADWRWMRDRPASPWYPTMRIFRQPRPGDWSGVVSEITRNLGTRVASQTSP